MLFVSFDLPIETRSLQVEVVVKTAFRHSICDQISVAMLESPIASIIRIPLTPAGSSKEISYADLPRSEEDQKKIATLIQTMAEQRKIVLLFKAIELKRIGTEIDHVHPLRFLGTVFSSSTLKACMKEIYNDSFKWATFFDGYARRMSLEADRNMLLGYLEDFAKEVNAASEDLVGYIQTRDWVGLIVFLMHHE